MKQTSGALSLLLSAYRSVFSAAYTKGIAAAVVLTAGLSAGANAAVTGEFASATDKAAAIEAGAEVSITVDGTGENKNLTSGQTPGTINAANSVTVNEGGTYSVLNGKAPTYITNSTFGVENLRTGLFQQGAVAL